MVKHAKYPNQSINNKYYDELHACNLAGVDKPTEDEVEDEGELVLVKELGAGRMRRSAESAESALPRYLHMQFNVGNETMTLQLERNTELDTNIPFTFAGEEGRKVYIPDKEVGNTQHDRVPYSYNLLTSVYVVKYKKYYSLVSGSFSRARIVARCS